MKTVWEESWKSIRIRGLLTKRIHSGKSGKFYSPISKVKLIVMLVTMSIFYLILSYLDVRFASLLSIITGAFSIVPVFGMMTAAVIILITVIVDGQRILGLPIFLEAVFILVLYFLLNQLIDWVVSPLIIGKSLKIHPLILFFTMIVAVSLFGIVGAILAAPSLAVARVIWIFLTEQDNR